MKLKEFLESGKKLNSYGVLVEMVLLETTPLSLTGSKEMQPYFQHIKSCDEFKKCNLHL